MNKEMQQIRDALNDIAQASREVSVAAELASGAAARTQSADADEVKMWAQEAIKSADRAHVSLEKIKKELFDV